MRNTITNLFFILIPFALTAQVNKLTAEASYPIPSGDNFLNESYNGIVDVGFDYHAYNFTIIDLGVSFNAALFSKNKESSSSRAGVDVRSYFLQPRFVAELNLIRALKPSIGLGYTVMINSVSSDRADFIDDMSNETQSGLNFNFGLAYYFTNRFFIQAQYDFIRLNKDDRVLDIDFNRNLRIFKVGIGLAL